MDFLAAYRTFFLAGEQRRFAIRAEGLRRRRRNFSAEMKGKLPVELVNQPPGSDVSAQGIAPDRQTCVGVKQFEAADAGMVASR